MAWEEKSGLLRGGEGGRQAKDEPTKNGFDRVQGASLKNLKSMEVAATYGPLRDAASPFPSSGFFSFLPGVSRLDRQSCTVHIGHTEYVTHLYSVCIVSLCLVLCTE